ncbi:MAG TPA: EAL domain-containing protein [Thermomicrobiales bacterium]|nr:EAL domain-containing protein [Thermomicrobiales bacterium]
MEHSRQSRRTVPEDRRLHEPHLSGSSPIGMHNESVIAESTGRVLDVSDAFASATGRAPGELIGSNLFDLVHPDDVASLRQMVSEVDQRPQGVWTHEFRVRSARVDWRWIDGRLRSLPRPQWGDCVEFIGIDVTESRMTRIALAGQNHILEMVTAGASLDTTLDSICSLIEVLLAGSRCSILLADDDGQRLYHRVSRGLPAGYIKAIEGLEIGPRVGSCGTAAFRKQTVVVADIETDPLWAGWRDVALKHELRACWSTPIDGERNGPVLGTFAVYYDHRHAPTLCERELVEQTGHLASVAIKHHRAKESLRQSEERWRALVQHSSDITVLIAPDRTLRYASPALTEVLGHHPDNVLHVDVFRYLHPDDAASAERLFSEALETPGISHPGVEIRVRDHAGNWRWLEVILTNLTGNPSVSAIVVNARDISDRKAAERQLQHLALTDPLTGLPNRTHFLQRLTLAFDHADQSHCPAILFLDLDRFKLVNDGYGHGIGDRLLMDTGHRLRECLQPGASLARWGGDEFTVLIPASSTIRATAVSLAERILNAFAEPFVINGRRLYISPSIGIGIGRSGEPFTQLIREADIALYDAKLRGRSKYAIFDPAVGHRLMLAMELENDLAAGLADGQFTLDYQPMIDLRSGDIIGAEALIRWRHPEYGLLAPTDFIPIAERSGFVVPLGIWVLEEACRQLARWDRSPGRRPPLRVGVNVSVSQVRAPGFEHRVTNVLRAHGLSPDRLVLEVTESVAADDEETVLQALTSLRAAGMSIVLDDLGTGYAGLRALQRLPLSGFKISQEFIAGSSENATATALIRAMLAMADDLGLRVTAEGIETPAELAHLQQLGCTRGQGYYFSRPLSPAEFEGLLQAEAPFAAAVGHEHAFSQPQVQSVNGQVTP